MNNPKALYQYDSKGKFIKKWKSYSDFKLEYYGSKKRPLLINYKDINYQILPDNTLISTERIDRDKVIKIIKIYNSEYVPKRELRNTTPIECYNLKEELLATFESEFALKVLLPNHYNNARSLIRNDFKYILGDLKFKYKKISENEQAI